ncbi:bifunctional adenosylcobinamide kinase/adenosylcobinamide-phosphate guanylyltransferase [Vibrio kasasachensis]|uniref:bifunctional adenosylcobinamide kinase/adenosylcobinamide-phosphate guanylyltransferase n=1 Tax=Vibrio kasasachensis TaxID=2910248 RepID=UPI003D14CCC0
MSIHLVLGGARSGKSSFAESLVLNKDRLNRHYVATATLTDNEMQQRIVHHQIRRDKSWKLHECPLNIAQLLSQFGQQDTVLVDCLTLWMSNVIFEDGKTADEPAIKAHVTTLISALERCPASVILVSNEVGLGIVPMGEVTRLFVDHAGWMNQAIAKVADQVTFVAAGLPMKLKG